MQLSELVRHGIAELKAAGVSECTSDIHLLLGHCLGKNRTQLLLAARDEVPDRAVQMFLTLLERRKRREPLAYILGEQEFWSLPFHVNPAVLIPRPETEFLLETVFDALRQITTQLQGAVLDLCCGSGVIAIVLALELKRRIVAIDLSATALDVTCRNCRRHEVDDLVVPIQGDLLTPVRGSRCCSLVVSNPPYVATSAIHDEVEPEVKEYEPRLALDGGERGLDLIYRIREDLPFVLAPGGQVFMEIGYDQGDTVAEMFTTSMPGVPDFEKIRIIRDYAGRDRVLYARIR